MALALVTLLPVAVTRPASASCSRRWSGLSCERRRPPKARLTPQDLAVRKVGCAEEKTIRAAARVGAGVYANRAYSREENKGLQRRFHQRGERGREGGGASEAEEEREEQICCSQRLSQGSHLKAEETGPPWKEIVRESRLSRVASSPTQAYQRQVADQRGERDAATFNPRPPQTANPEEDEILLSRCERRSSAQEELDSVAGQPLSRNTYASGTHQTVLACRGQASATRKASHTPRHACSQGGVFQVKHRPDPASGGEPSQEAPQLPHSVSWQ